MIVWVMIIAKTSTTWMLSQEGLESKRISFGIVAGIGVDSLSLKSEVDGLIGVENSNQIAESGALEFY